MPRFSAHLTQLFTERPFHERFAAAARAGFEGCEMRFPFDHPAEMVAGWIHDSGLASVIFNLPAGDWAAGERGIAAVPGRESEFRDGVHHALEYARVMGTSMLHAMAGKISGNAAHETFVENLRYAGKAAAGEGRVITIEPINPGDVAGYFLTRQDQAHAIVTAVGQPS